MASVNIQQIRAGTTFKMGSDLFRCLEYNHIRGAQMSRIKLKMKNLRSGAIYEQSFGVNESIETAHIESKKMQYLYHDENLFHFMDQETFEQISIPAKLVGDLAHYIKDGFVVSISFYEEEPIDVDLPASVELKVIETSPGFKGDTVSGGKPATLETGLVVQVPFFTNVGDMVKVDTRDGKYLGRA